MVEGLGNFNFIFFSRSLFLSVFIPIQSIDSSSLPPATRQKLHSIFGLIEKEFEVMMIIDN